MNNNEITAEFKRKIEIDIMKCKNQINKEGSEALYNELISKYTMFDPNFKSDISSTGKVAVLGEEFDYRPELKVIASKLEMIIDLNFKKNLYNAVKLNLDELIVEGYFICNYEVIDSNTSGLLFSYVSGDEYKKWNTKIELFNERYLKEHPLYDQIKKFNNSNHFESLKKLIALLETVSDDVVFFSNSDKINAQQKSQYTVNNSNKVFIVHGHDVAAKESVARFLEKIGMKAIILHEQPDEGKTIIEKIEQNTDVAFAIVLYTPCDLGRAKDEIDEKSRARQNVVFEHGYLIGKLGRSRVCALVKDNIETPGDISGVVYKKMDDNKAWMYEICKEMKATGIQIDVNKLF